jgi:flagellar motor switch/type III secretory pathway protein FliN
MEQSAVDEELPAAAVVEDAAAASLSLQQARYLADIEVALSVEVGMVSINAEQLIDLAPGQSIPFQCDMGQELILRFAGEDVARGRFCAEEGEIFVEILSVKSGEETPAG